LSAPGAQVHFELPEYSTAAKDNIVPWASDTGGVYNECEGPYENAGPPDSGTAELGGALCHYKGDTHPGYDGPGTSTAPDEATGCQDNWFQNGDLDFDG
jgi:hypothetical protein